MTTMTIVGDGEVRPTTLQSPPLSLLVARASKFRFMGLVRAQVSGTREHGCTYVDG